MSKIFKWFVNILFIIVIALLLAYLALRTTDKIEIYRVKTGSMEEKIHVGDYILIYRKKSYNVGDVVTYTSNDGFITHRIIKKEGGKIITKGDANNAEDKEIVESTIVGKVIIVGGILNIIITYKYVIVCVLLSLYLFSCYFEGRKKEEFVIDANNDEKKLDMKDNIDNNEMVIEEKSFSEENELNKDDNLENKEETNDDSNVINNENKKEIAKEEKIENEENVEIEDSLVLEKKENIKKNRKDNAKK